MPLLQITNFGPIQSFDFYLKKLNILIGKQASGKSTTAKLLFFFKMIPLWLAIFNPKDKKGNLFELFQKDLRKKFLDLFGPVYHQRNLKLVYFFNDHNDDLYIQIFQDHQNKNRYISIRFDTETRTRIEELLTHLKDISSNTQKIDGKISEKIIGQAIENNFYQSMLESSKKIFNQNQIPLFIPAGRTQLTLFSGQLVYFNESDFLTNNFLRTIQNIRDQVGTGLEETETLAGKTWAHQPDPVRAELARALITKILRGSYRVEHGEERIYHTQYLHTKLSVASSGQQESLWILLTAYMLILERENISITFEEPEAHLYPEAQDAIMQLLVLLLGSASDNQIIITTHSPYLLTSINNLLAAHHFGKQKPDEVSRIIDRLLWLPSESLSVYQLDGKGEDIFDKELNMIRAEKIDSASQIMNDKYEKLISIAEA